MAWDTERTKRLLLEAATAEFCQFGLAGARVDRIAAGAGVNKERIYQYFGKKDLLFDAVIASQLNMVMDEVPIEGEGVDAVAGYAGRLFDHHRADATLPRLLFWEGLERGDYVVDRSCRAANCASKVDRIMAALPGIARGDAADLLLTIISLCDAWAVLPELGGLVAGAAPDRAERRRADIVRTVSLAAQALLPEPAR
ncbi:TetR/AcrR family transcriptional regulator [Arthrobacter sp. CJ23]|uniref:TetR/AcrR family transcriptional regulator n=1 Tax=Arthrobacter sp. CJ23 TaxID=2972479 RepID=UPI00215CF39F|nr:TetR family transcriptional regulator [Arthrobacter sp. CJ23]UVJ39271.1 TetR family transcriptional regulator [Arthrobacter sp. CJ23]